jgi:four helix bundle protein
MRVVTEAKFNLAERTARFGEATIQFVIQIKRTAVNSPLISQLIRSATSIGANYCEADEAGTKKEFTYRISVCNRETRETKYWLRMIVAACPDKKEEARNLWKEADELNRIFATIHRTSIQNKQQKPQNG